jgi:hypothetical protein
MSWRLLPLSSPWLNRHGPRTAFPGGNLPLVGLLGTRSPIYPSPYEGSFGFATYYSMAYRGTRGVVSGWKQTVGASRFPLRQMPTRVERQPWTTWDLGTTLGTALVR